MVGYYDPIAGRFLSTEPVDVRQDSGDNFNRYWYANNNPYSRIDPDGRQARAFVSSLLAADLAVPEPTDVAWPKWAGWGVAIGVAAAVDLVILEAVSEDEPPGTRALDDLETIHAPDHPQNDPEIGELTDAELENAIRNPSDGQRVTVRGNKVLDGNTRINEAKKRGWDGGIRIPVDELPELPDNIDENPLGPYGD